jgi:hypothetical protein
LTVVVDGDFQTVGRALARGVRRAATIALVAAAVVSGCGPFPGGSEAPNARTNQGGETTSTVYTDARFNYKITGPGPLKPRSDGTASFAGEDELLEVAVVGDARAADPAALAQSDLKSLSGSVSDYQVLIQPVAVTLGGQRVIKLTYSSTGSSHTGKSIKFLNVRYYIAKNDKMLAVISYRDAATEFDAQEADGFASSVRWL